MSNLDRLKDQLLLIGEQISQSPERITQRNSVVSGWSVGQHWDHLLKVDITVLESLCSNNAFPITKPKSIIGWLVLFTGFIPRGKANSPQKLVGEEVAADILLEQTKRAVRLLDAVPLSRLAVRNPFMEHPFLGAFTAADWVRFLLIHHRHHQKIVVSI
jgi:hypothetical protein